MTIDSVIHIIYFLLTDCIKNSIYYNCVEQNFKKEGCDANEILETPNRTNKTDLFYPSTVTDVFSNAHVCLRCESGRLH